MDTSVDRMTDAGVKIVTITAMIERIDHINLVVNDLDEMTRFYSQVLGLIVSKRVAIKGPWIDHVVALAEVEAKVVYLDSPQGPRVELIQYMHPRGTTRPGGLETANTDGIRHLAFRVNGIDLMVTTLREAGVVTLGPVRRVPESQVTYDGNVRKRLVYFHDPERNLLELCEYE